jgi:hypothetical protein
MFCPKCGAGFESGTQFCATCGEPLPQIGAPAAPVAYRSPGGPDPAVKVPDYLIPAILTTLCCCMPFGIAGIVYASQASTKSRAGDYEGALAAAKNAGLWCWLSFGAGLFVTVIYIILMAVGAISAPK